MYIPVSYFGAGEGCITATGGITGSYVSGGVLWKYHKFDSNNFESSSFNVVSGSTLRGKLLVIGGGGSGGATGGSTSTAAGGGGGGGVVYYDQFPIISGSYNLVVAKGVPGVYGFRSGDTAFANAGNTGRYSSVQTPFGPYTPFTSSVITAFGGGGGGVAGYGVTASFGLIPGAGGSSGGGNAQNDNGYAIASSSNFAGDGFGGINLNDQGNFGGSIPADSISFNTSFMVTGGGGAGASSLSVLNTGGTGGSPQYTDGGDGLQIDIDGTPTYYAGGGGSYSSVKAGYTNDGLGAGNAGGGGRAERGTSGGDFSESGSGGLIVFAYRMCPFGNDCTTYVATAGSTAATLNFINCYTSLPMSISVNPFTTSSVCSRTFAEYPYITGTGATLVSSSLCTNQNILIQQTASVVFPYRGFSSQSFAYVNNGVGYTGSIASGSGILPVVNTFYQSSQIQYNGSAFSGVTYTWMGGPIPAGCPTFGWAAGAGSSSILYPSGGEAWYMNVTNTNTFNSLPSQSAVFYYYVNESGSLINDSIPFGGSKTILTQTPITAINARGANFDSPTKINFVPISKYSGSVTVPTYLQPNNTTKFRFTMKVVNPNYASLPFQGMSVVAAATVTDFSGSFSGSITPIQYYNTGSTYTLDAYNLPFQLAYAGNAQTSNPNTWITDITQL